MKKLKVEKVRCSKCGKLTVWDDEIDGEVLCKWCWDVELGKSSEWKKDWQKRWYKENRDRLLNRAKVRYREWYADHREEEIERVRLWQKDNRDKVREYNKRWWRVNGRNYRENREKILEGRSRKRRSDSGSVVGKGMYPQMS